MLLRGVESRWTYGVLLVLLFFSHMIPFGFAMLLVVTFAVEWQRWRVALQSIPALLLCGWYFAARVVNGNVDGHAGMVASVPYLSRMFWVFKANSYLKCWGFLNPAMGERDSVALQVLGTKIFVLLFALNAVVALLLLGMMVKSVLRSMGEWRGDGFFWVSVAVFAAAGCLMPGAAAGISDPGGRMLQVAVWCGLCAAPARAMWTGMVAATCGVVLMTANAVLLGSVAMRPPVMGETGGMLPARVRQFGHVYYADRWQYPIAVESGRMDLEIYPTAMFLKRDAGGR